ncbi:helix-turn-helix domain-containing protein [Lysobacter yananisis]|uniref:Helix-turn-helix domain-containing protein n=1 Tax=Lysobacter yananisis TaxID=1003114 RepID=A0ABY9PBA8_9GAMM|nr:helix-turn-helix domain-containing protein [Lysobacter yananisis]WMT03325.1 helix-turn-helix domain-containing protein [Lysobacter yananisis]
MLIQSTWTGMRPFDEQLLRLKQVLKLTDDQDVADALGMNKAAFSARKTRGAFPEDKLFALAAKQPELKIDPAYVITGRSEELERRLQAVSAATAIAGKVKGIESRGDVQAAAFDALVNALAPDEQELLRHYRTANENGRAAIIATAAAQAGLAITAPPPQRRGGTRGK